ncbi:MAG: hypothetical protein GY738_28750 [Pseudoalteromonas sp.]|nr:hypothetical protein [Pseudoalteromonas sp.]
MPNNLLGLEMKICHLHIGMHKTGSSSVQNYFEKHRGELDSVGFYYADMGSSNHSGPLLYALRKDPKSDSEIASFKLTATELENRILYYRDKLSKSLEREYENILFSAEAFIKLSEEELNIFKQMLLNYVDEIRVYCYVREPLPFTNSSFQQIIKTIPVALDDQNIFPNYERKFRKFGDLFGNINYRVYSQSQLTNGDVIEDFCEWLGVPFLGAEKANISLGATAVKFLIRFQSLRKVIKVTQESLELVENTLSRLPNQKVKLPTKKMRTIIESNYEDFLWMRNQLLKHSPRSGFSIESIEKSSLGNIEGHFSENEKDLLNSLANTYPEFGSYVLKETGRTVLDIVSSPTSDQPELKFRIRKLSGSEFQGWAHFSHNGLEPVQFDLFLNDEFVGKIASNTPRSDLLSADGVARNIGFDFKFDRELSINDTVTLLLDEKIVYSGSI